MTKTLMMAAVLVLAACGERRSEAPADTTGAMAPATTDTAMMSHDTAMMRSDTAMARDTTK